MHKILPPLGRIRKRQAVATQPGSRLIRKYWFTYALTTAGTALFAAAGTWCGVVHGSMLALLLAWVPLAVLALAAGRRINEFRAYRHIPGPKPGFFLGNLRSLLSEDHGGRDQALVELHRMHGPVVRLHLAWGSKPFVSMSKVPDMLGRRDVDSNRRADGDILPNSLMGLPGGEQHQRHRKELNPVFTPAAVRDGAARTVAVSEWYLDCWKSGETRHGSLKADLHHWSAHTLATYLCGDDWEPGGDLTEYLAAIAALEETISFDAFHPRFAKWFSPARRARARDGYRYLFDLFAGKLEQRRQRGGENQEDALGILAALIGRWTHEECVEEMISLVAGGTDAMSYTTAQSLVLLSQSPQVLEHLRVEIAGSAGQARQPAILHVISEAMRLFPAVPFSSKVVPQGGVIEEHRLIPGGTNLMWMKTAIGLNEQVFHDPHHFIPSRFSGPSEQRESLNKLLPFGAGPRHCPGRSLAEFQCGSFLAAIVTRFEIEPIELVDVRFSATVSVTPSAVPVRLVPRRQCPQGHDHGASAPPLAGRCPFAHQAAGTQVAATSPAAA